MPELIINLSNKSTKAENTKTLLSCLLRYTYDAFSLDYDLLCKIFDHTNIERDYEELFQINDFVPGTRDCEYPFLTSHTISSTCGKHYDNTDAQNARGINLIKKIHEHIINYGPKSVKFAGYTELIVTNSMGICTMGRGTKSLDSLLGFYPVYKISKDRSINMYDLITALHKIRSHKFENWYELISYVKDMNMTENTIQFSVGGDHGS